MKPWMKFAIGCLALSIIAVFLFVAGVVGLGYWAKGKMEEVTGGGPAVEEARKAANAVPFVRPPDHVVAEDRLVRFIEIRASVFSVYERYRGEIESRMARVKEGKPVDFSDISTGLTLMGEIRRAETLALGRHGMSEREYEFITAEVYKSMAKGFGEEGKMAIESAAIAGQAAAEAMKGMKGNGVETLPKEAREALAQAGVDLAASSREVSKGLAEMRTAPENEVLFGKYEAELKKYAMPGLRVLFDPGAEELDESKGGRRP